MVDLPAEEAGALYEAEPRPFGVPFPVPSDEEPLDGYSGYPSLEPPEPPDSGEEAPGEPCSDELPAAGEDSSLEYPAPAAGALPVGELEPGVALATTGHVEAGTAVWQALWVTVTVFTHSAGQLSASAMAIAVAARPARIAAFPKYIFFYFYNGIRIEEASCLWPWCQE